MVVELSEIKDKYNNLKIEIEQYRSEIAMIRVKIKDNKKIKEQLEQNKITEEQYNQMQKEYDSLNNKQERIMYYFDKLIEYNKYVDKYMIINQKKDNIENNKKVREKMKSIEKEIEIYEEDIKDKTEEYTQLLTKIGSNTETQRIIKENINDYTDTLKKRKTTDYFLKVVQKSGLPFQIITDVIQYLNKTTNIILELVEDFRIEITLKSEINRSQNKSIKIDLFILKKNNSKILLELASGYEKFIASLALRIAFTKISKAPKPNFLIIDEGFGNFDSTNLNKVDNIFKFLKQEYDFLLIISHIPMLKDYIDNIINIKYDGTYSKISYN